MLVFLQVERVAGGQILYVPATISDKKVILCDDLIRTGHNLTKCVKGIIECCTILQVVTIIDEAIAPLRSQYLEPIVGQTGLTIRALGRFGRAQS